MAYQAAVEVNLSPTDRMDSFTKELTDLSIKWGVGLAQPTTPFLMESDDYDRQYRWVGDAIEFA
jgi:hypothetical protein